MAFMQQQTTPTNGKRELKIAVVGSGGEPFLLLLLLLPGQKLMMIGVGKSAVTIRFVTSQFYDQ